MWMHENQPDGTPDKPTDPPETGETIQQESQEQPARTHNAQQDGPSIDAPRPRRRGFAAMDRDRVKQIASKGGRAAHAAGTAHQFSSDEARIAGRKGGMAPHVRRGGVRRHVSTSTASSHSPDSQNHGQGDRR